MKKKIYICGPMTGHKDFNFPAFFETERAFTKLGFECFNPARMDIDIDGIDRTGMTGNEEVPNLKEIAKRDLLAVLECDIIYCLKGWEQDSKGSRAEWATAIWIGLEIIYQ